MTLHAITYLDDPNVQHFVKLQGVILRCNADVVLEVEVPVWVVTREKDPVGGTLEYTLPDGGKILN